MQDKVEVTCEDREAAADFQAAIGRPAAYVREMRGGDHDNGPTCQAFARHREQATASLREERDALREALAWAVSQGRLSYTRRVPGQNEHFCDRIDAINALLKDHNA
jgi:hypothetical protein